MNSQTPLNLRNSQFSTDQNRNNSFRTRRLRPHSIGIGIAIAAIGFAAWAYADTPSSISRTTFSSGNTISSSEVNTNFSNLYDSVNGLLKSIFVTTQAYFKGFILLI